MVRSTLGIGGRNHAESCDLIFGTGRAVSPLCLAEEGDPPDRPTTNVDLASRSPDTPDATETQLTSYRAVATNFDDGAINHRQGANLLPVFLPTTK